MHADEVAEFEAGGFAEQAVALRRWDEAAKDPDASSTPTLDHFLPLLESLIR
jgi:gamma-butyrobetaine dioxygenase